VRLFQRLAIVLLLCLGGFLLPLTLLRATAVTPQTASAIPPGILPSPNGIPVSRNGEGRLNDAHLSVFGPNICTAFGDPFSPFNSNWEPGSYTYNFQIRIPADYPDDILRVEIFDPDSINKAANSDEVIYSALATSLNPTLFPPGAYAKSCSSADANQKEPCLIATGEESLVGTVANLTIDRINPFWLVRVDENRGSSVPGICGVPANYTPAYNTATRYELSYFRDAANGAVEQIALAAYTGQTGDGVRDNGDHDTDLRWVSPGGQANYDQPVVVPASYGSFEVDLTQDIPNIVIDPATGERTLLLAVTTVSGASENGFQFWAGPATYIYAVPSKANERNLVVLNNPVSHDPAGVIIEAIDNLPLNSNTDNVSIVPLATIGPEYAGMTVYISHFDMDSGSKPPVVFYMDSLAFTPDSSTDGVYEDATDFAVSYGGGVDPDGRCFDGGASYNGECNNTWVYPVYAFTLPSEHNCDYSNPTPETCTPFYGGQLFARMKTGNHDTFVWRLLSGPERPYLDPSLGCSAFPIGIQAEARSVSPPNIALDEAQPGYLYQVNAGLGPGDFTWLAWNLCSNDLTALENSLAWPGNTFDYTPLPGSCAAYDPPRVAGYVEPGDLTDRSMNLGDFIAAYTGTTSSTSLQAILAQHIGRNRTLRLPIWDMAYAGSEPTVQVSRFALFRPVDASLTEGWLTVEFVGWDDSCGQIASFVPMTGLSLSDPASAGVNEDVAITAVITPSSATTPITYTWEATDIAPFTVVGTGVDGRFLNWSQPGPKTITVTAAQNQTMLTATHTLTVTPPPSLQLSPSCGMGPLATFTVLGSNWPVGQDVILYWQNTSNFQSRITGHDGSFAQTWTKTISEAQGEYAVIGVSGGDVATAVFTVPCTPQGPTSVAIDGPASGPANVFHTFTAHVSPNTATYPITYVWEIAGQATITHTGSLSDTVQIAWPAIGQTDFTVLAQNVYGSVQTQFIFEVTGHKYYLPFVPNGAWWGKRP